MKALITGTFVALALGATAAAQDRTVKSELKVDGDDVHAVQMQGCLQRAADNSGFVLLGGITAAGEDLSAKTTVKTDVDDDERKVETKTATKIDHDDDAVGTSGSRAAFLVRPRDGVDLAAHAGHQVELTAVMIEAKKGSDDDAEIKISEQTKVENEHAPDAKAKSETTLEVPRTSSPQLMALSVKSVGTSCGQ